MKTTIKQHVSNLILELNPAFFEMVIYRYTKKKKNKLNYLLQLKNNQLKLYNMNNNDNLVSNEEEIDQVLNSNILGIYDETASYCNIQVL